MRIVSPSLALGLALLAGVSGSSLLAQDQTQPATGPAATAPAPSMQAGRHADPHRQAKRLAKTLGLTPDQESKLEPILADRAQQMQSAHADTTLAPTDMQTRMRSIRQDSDAKVNAILTDAQRQQFAQIKASRKARKQQQNSTATS